MFTIEGERWFQIFNEQLPYELRHNPNAERIRAFFGEQHKKHRVLRNGYGIAALLVGLLSVFQDDRLHFGLLVAVASCLLVLCFVFQCNLLSGPVPEDVIKEYVRREAARRGPGEE